MTSLPWYIGGPLIGLMVPLLLIVREKQLGISSSMRFAISYLFPKREYFKYNRLKDAWQLQFAVGMIISGIVFSAFGLVSEPQINLEQSYGVQAVSIYELKNWSLFLFGGIAVGFGARYANGCTAGHCIMGVSLFSWRSLLTTIAFFAGGLFATHIILPLIF
ncbi:MAG: YeeE/YedE thiosulfate transporter family protein [Crocinitomicaceae bacterium]|nr:YeeE/YedE thiosulfate transporter family protein [Crocinitomicaceae bacterium]